jgi:DNA-binding beta-propeller fold protein YncE
MPAFSHPTLLKSTGVASLLLATCLSASAFDGWHLSESTAIPGPSTAWDYVSLHAESNNLFIGHRKTGLQVFNLVSKKVVKVIDGTPVASSNGAVLIPEFDLGISTNEDGTLTPFSLKTLEARPAIKLGEELDSAHYDPVTKRLLVNMASDKEGTGLIVLEVPSLKTLGVIRVTTKKPEHAEADGNGNLLMASRDEARVYRISMKDMAVTAQWPTPGCVQTNGLALDKANQRIFLGCRGTAPVATLTTPGPVTKPSFAVMNAQTGAILYTQEIGGGNDAVVYDAELKRIFLANGVHSQLTVIEQVDADTYKPSESLGTGNGVRTMAMHPVTKKLYAVTSEGSADYGKKITTSVSPFYANVFFADRFMVQTYGK